jgi:hypothetical protein
MSYVIGCLHCVLIRRIDPHDVHSKLEEDSLVNELHESASLGLERERARAST